VSPFIERSPDRPRVPGSDGPARQRAPPIDWTDRTSILDGAVITAPVFSGSPLPETTRARAPCGSRSASTSDPSGSIAHSCSSATARSNSSGVSSGAYGDLDQHAEPTDSRVEGSLSDGAHLPWFPPDRSPSNVDSTEVTNK
jgi:hypothetical protein